MEQKHKFHLSVLDITTIGIMTATLEAGKLSLSFLPNIEIVSLLIILYTLFLGPKVFFAIYIFVLIEGLLYGFGIWFIMYLYVWSILALCTLLIQKSGFVHKKSALFTYSTLSGFYGLAFGGLCTLPYLVLSGPKAAFAWWVAGIPRDITHCIGNFTLCLLLFHPLHSILQKIKMQSFNSPYL